MEMCNANSESKHNAKRLNPLTERDWFFDETIRKHYGDRLWSVAKRKRQLPTYEAQVMWMCRTRNADLTIAKREYEDIIATVRDSDDTVGVVDWDTLHKASAKFWDKNDTSWADDIV